jgi:outer membrane protein assembly factor BamB
MESVGQWKPLRVWIPILLLPLMLLMRFVPDLVPDGPSMIWMASAFGPFLVGLLVILWWLVASRARWFERILGILGIVAAVGIEQAVCHESMRGPLLIVMTIPMAIAAFALGAILFGAKLSIQRTWLAIGLALLGAGYSALLRTDGVWGNFSFGFDWRWNQTSETLANWDYLQSRELAPIEKYDKQELLAALKTAPWPGFRGPKGDSTQSGLRFSDDWKSNPPLERWRNRIGPAWSSFAIGADRIFTQEQQMEDEVVSCYNAVTGEPIWSYTNPSRFFEALGGLGPRSTPTLADGSIYALGAEGYLVRLNAIDGKLIWKVDLKEASERETPPMWGFSCSPCVDGGLVIVHAGGKQDKGIIAYKVEDGQVAWTAKAGEMSYSSVQKINLLGTDYLCLLSNLGAHLLEPVTGKPVLDYEFQHQGYRACQAQVIDGNKLLIPAGMGTGTRLVEFSSGDSGLQAKELWTSKEMKPDYNDILVYDGNIYGFDNGIFACIGLEDGKRKWKGGRYEKGQAFLLADSGLILVVSEKGELVLLKATPEKHLELGKIEALSDKTWNHPVVVGDRLFVRNAEEVVCYQLASIPAE